MHALTARLAPLEVVFGGLKPTLLYGRANHCARPAQIAVKLNLCP